MGLGEGVLQLPQLLLGEGGAVAPSGRRGACARIGSVTLAVGGRVLPPWRQGGGGGGEGQRHGAGAFRLDLLEGSPFLTCNVQPPVRQAEQPSLTNQPEEPMGQAEQPSLTNQPEEPVGQAEQPSLTNQSDRGTSDTRKATITNNPIRKRNQ